MRKKILVISNNMYSFVKEDIFLLKQFHIIDSYIFNFRKIKKYYELIKKIKNAEIILCWLAHYYSFIVVIINKFFFKRKLLIIVGGDEVEKLDEYSYGALSSYKRYLAVKYSLLLSDYIISVNDKLKNSIIKIYNPKVKVSTIRTSYDPEFWNCSDNKKDIILTVGNINSTKRFYIKGIDRFINLAKNLPQFQFIIVGLDRSKFKDIIDYPNNLTIIEFATKDELKKYYSISKVYCQLSRSEGTPNVVCEAMLSECIPVCTNVGDMEYLCSEVGYLVNENDLSSLKSVVSLALSANNGLNARKFIESSFSISKRKNELLQIIRE